MARLVKYEAMEGPLQVVDAPIVEVVSYNQAHGRLQNAFNTFIRQIPGKTLWLKPSPENFQDFVRQGTSYIIKRFRQGVERLYA